MSKIYKERYSFNIPTKELNEIISYAVDDCRDGGTIERIDSKVDNIVRIIEFLADNLPEDKQTALAELLGYIEVQP